MAAFAQARQFGAARVIGGQPAADEAGDGDVGLVAVLLEEQPLQRLRALPAIGGQVRRSVGQVSTGSRSIRPGVRPSASSSSGTLPLGFFARNSGVRVSPAALFTSTQRYGRPSCSSSNCTLKQLPDAFMP